jgi:hypothetical protein
MAASLEDVFADPSYVDDSEAAFWCRPAWESDEEDREAASKYAAALIIFNFAWTAYEAAIEISANGVYPKDKVPVRARRLFQAEPELSAGVEVFDVSYKVARQICIRLPSIASSIQDIEKKYALSGAAAAAELGRYSGITSFTVPTLCRWEAAAPHARGFIPSHGCSYS